MKKNSTKRGVRQPSKPNPLPILAGLVVLAALAVTLIPRLRKQPDAGAAVLQRAGRSACRRYGHHLHAGVSRPVFLHLLDGHAAQPDRRDLIFSITVLTARLLPGFSAVRARLTAGAFYAMVVRNQPTDLFSVPRSTERRLPHARPRLPSHAAALRMPAGR